LELVAGADDTLRWAQQSAYGTSFPTETKRFRGGGWYFSMDQAFDLAVGWALDHPPLNDPRTKYLEAILSNLNYEGGANPVNVCYVTGLGWRRQREIVHHYAMNDRRVLPPSGICLGNIQSGFMWLDRYQKELGALSFPLDGAEQGAPYPIYDRWGDSFNVQTEFVVVNQARALATAALLMAMSPLKTQSWNSAAGRIETSGTSASLVVPGMDLSQARILWEAADREPEFSRSLSFGPGGSRPAWIEAEAQWPDGRRVVAVRDAPAAPAAPKP
jgi:hypothetical protein